MMQDHISMFIANFMKGFDGVMQILIMEMVVSHDFLVDVVPPYIYIYIYIYIYTHTHTHLICLKYKLNMILKHP